MGIDFSIQMCTYNRKDSLKKSLEALFRQDFPGDRYEIILIDDGSTDGTGDMVKSLNPPCKFTYEYQENSGIAVGRNRGVRAATGKYVLFIDDDVVASSVLLKEHLKTHEKFPRSVVRGWVNHVTDFESIDEKNPKLSIKDYSLAFFWTSNVSVEREHIIKAGMFDESFREYGWEDLELGHRLRYMGLKRRINNKAVAFHLKGNWKKSQLGGILAQARAKGRMALVFLEKDPCNHTRVTTGIHSTKLLWHRFLEMGGVIRNFCKKIIESHAEDEMSGVSLMCARLLYNLDYFKTIQDILSERSGNSSGNIKKTGLNNA